MASQVRRHLEAAIKSPSKLRQLHLLVEIYRLSEGWNRRQIPTAGLYNEGHEWGIDVSALRSDFTALMDAGWIYFEASAAGVDEILIKQEGIDVALGYQKKRSNLSMSTRFRPAETARTRTTHDLTDQRQGIRAGSGG